MTHPHPFRFRLLGDNVRSAADLMETARRAEGDHIELSIVSSVVVAERRRDAAERLVRERGWDGLSVERVLELPSIFIGSVDQIADEMRERRDRYAISYYVVPDRSLKMVAPIVARLAGI